jgi:hypothetical protein
MFLNKICDLEILLEVLLYVKMEGVTLKRLLIIKGSFDNFVRTEFLSGSNKGAQVFVSRIAETPCDTNLTFISKRRHFPSPQIFIIIYGRRQKHESKEGKGKKVEDSEISFRPLSQSIEENAETVSRHVSWPP